VALPEDQDPMDCYLRALPGEPKFTLLARDESAAHWVRQWAYERSRAISRGEAPESDREVVANAQKIAKDMAAWRAENVAEKPWRRLNVGTTTETPAPAQASDNWFYNAKMARRQAL